jgi:hypothetical protein
MPEIDVLSEDAARGTWAMEDVLRWTAGGSDLTQVLHGYGHYHDSYARVDGRWLIQSSSLSRLSVTVGPA